MRAPLVAAALLAAFGAWLALPRAEDDGAPRFVCLVDVSASVRRARPDWGAWVGARLEHFANDAAASGADAWVLSVADGRREIARPMRGSDLVARLSRAPLDPVPRGLGVLGTDLGAAIESVEPWLNGGRGGRIVVLGDGDVGGDPRAAADALGRLAARGVACAFEEAPAPTRPDVRVARLDVPARVEPGVPLFVRVELTHDAAHDKSAQLAVELLEPGSDRVVARASADVVFDASNVHRTSLELVPPHAGLWLVRARVELPGDASPENDVREELCRVGGGLAGAVVHNNERDAARALAQALQFGVAASNWAVLSPDALGAAIDRLDVVCALDVPPIDLPVEVLEPYLRAGGGLFVVGGSSQHVPSARGDGVDLLPLVCVPPGDRPRDVVLLLDGSGSMAGEPFAAVRSAARDLLLSTPPGDGLQVVVFTDGLRPSPLDVRGGEVVDERALNAAERWLAGLEAPGGRTSILYSLEQWMRLRAARRASDGERRAVVVMLTDGQENLDAPNVEARLLAARAELERLDAALYTVAIGSPIDHEFLEQLVPSPERRLAPAASDLRRAVADAASGERVHVGPLSVQATPEGRDLGLPSILAPWSRASRATLRDGADLLCKGVNDEPLGGIWSVGSGRVANLAGGPSWVPDLLQRPARFAGLVRHLAQRRDETGATLVRDEDGLLLVGVESTAPRLVGVLTLAGGAPSTLALDSQASGWRASTRALAELERSAAGGWLSIEGLGRWPIPARPPRELRGIRESVAVPIAAATLPLTTRAGHPAAVWVLALAGALAALAALPLPGVARRGIKAAAQRVR